MACAKAQGWALAEHVPGGAEGQGEEGSGKKGLGERGSHSQRDLWALPGVLVEGCRGNRLRRKGQKQEQPGNSCTGPGGATSLPGPGGRWRVEGAAAAGPSVPVPQLLCHTEMITLVLPRGRCVGPPHPSPYANSPGTIMFSTFCRQGDSALTAHLVPRISAKPGVWRMGYTFIF